MADDAVPSLTQTAEQAVSSSSLNNKIAVSIKSNSTCCFCITSLIFSLFLISISVFLFIVIDSDPNCLKDPNAYVFLHKNCIVLANNVNLRCYRSTVCQCKLKLKFPILSNQNNNDSTNETFRISLTPLFPVSTFSHLTPNDVIDCYTNSDETKVSIEKFSPLYHTVRIVAIVLMVVGGVFTFILVMALVLNYLEDIKKIILRNDLKEFQRL